MDPYSKSDDNSKKQVQKKMKELEISAVFPPSVPNNPFSIQPRYPQQQSNFYPQPPQFQQNQVPIYPSYSNPTPRSNAPRNPPYHEWRNRTFTPLAIPMIEVFQRLLSSGHLAPIPARPLREPLPQNFRNDLHCAYHSNQPGHETETCRSLKHKVQDLIDTGMVNLEDKATPNVTTNPLPNHPGVNMISKDDHFVPQDLIGISNSVIRFCQPATSREPDIAMTGYGGRRSSNDQARATWETRRQEENWQNFSRVHVSLPTRPKITLPRSSQVPNYDPHRVPFNYERINPHVNFKRHEVDEIGGITRSGRVYTSTELEHKRKGKAKEYEQITQDEIQEFIKTLKKSEFEIVDQLKRTPANISILSLLITSDVHREALMAVLKDAQVPRNISRNSSRDGWIYNGFGNYFIHRR